jgi:predicted DNA-binding transcriptional regulator YafY
MKGKMPDFDSGTGRTSSNEASESVVRKVAMIVELLRQKNIRFSEYERQYHRDYRSFQRDLQQLRAIGVEAGFTISNIADKELVRLLATNDKVKNLNRGAERAERLMATIARALGEPISRELGSSGASKGADDDFYMFATPKLIGGSAIADIAELLRAAHSSPAGRAAVRFKYPERGGPTVKERDVEPYRIVIRSGGFYLIGYDRGVKEWRTFALDRFRSKPARAGTCPKQRQLPTEYASDDVLGFMKTIGKRVSVTVELSAKVAASATARSWQAEQRIEKLSDGRAKMTFVVTDVSEVVRWALGFGAEARVIAPPEAVKEARETIAALFAEYEA